MKVVAGTSNPNKLAGIERAFKTYFKDVELTYVEVPSGVPPQPFGLEQIVEGARNRAINALKASKSCDYGVGVEGGMFKLGGHYYEVQVAAIVDSDGRITLGLSPSFQVPDRFVDEILKGKARELEEVVDRYFKTSDIGRKGGIVKVLSKSAVSRDELSYYSVLMALLPRVNERLYDLGCK